MLGPADLALVERDRELPALPLLLDAAALSEWLTWQTGEDCRVRPARLRYKPGTSCVLAFTLERGPRGDRVACLARTYPTHLAHKIEKALVKAPVTAVVAAEHSLPLLVTDLTGDRDVVALARLGGGERAELLHRLLPGRDDLADAPLRTLRHNPERRWVGLLEPAAGEPVVLRAHRRGGFEQHVRAYSVLGGASSPTPRLLGRSRRHALAAVEWVPGRELDLAGDPAEAVRATGAALARLHAGSGHRLPRIGVEDQVASVRRAAAQCVQLQPHLAGEVRALAQEVVARLHELGSDEALLHGDFSTDQVVLGEDGAVTLIDLDAAGRGDPAIDLASARAVALAHHPDGVPGALELLHAGYQELRPLPSASALAVHTATQLLRRAGEPFRSRTPRWPEQLARALALAQHELAATPLSQGTR